MSTLSLFLRRAAPWSSRRPLFSGPLFSYRFLSSGSSYLPPGGRPRRGGAAKETFRLRTHAVSLYSGDYADDGAEDAFAYDNDDDDEQEEEDVSLLQEKDEIAEWAQRQQDEYDERKRRWIENAKPPVRVPVIDSRGRAYGRGGRKTASARVWIQPGFGEVVVNRKELREYFPRESDRELILAPLVATETCGLFDLQCFVEGGGITGQAGAIRHGLARALNHYNPDLYRPPLKRLGYLTRDPRMVERKKIGKVKARKSPQWVRR